EQLMPLHQEFAVIGWHAHGAVVEDHVVPAVMRNEPIASGEIDACLPLLRRDGVRMVGRGFGMNVHRRNLLCIGLQDDLLRLWRRISCPFEVGMGGWRTRGTSRLRYRRIRTGTYGGVGGGRAARLPP